MQKIKIIGGNKLNGEITISGAKNAALKHMAASLLTSEDVHLSNVPDLADIKTMDELIAQHGVIIKRSGNNMSLSAPTITSTTAPYEIVCKMRASVLVLGPLLAREGHARVSLPGGCAIGTRPINLHLMALEAMGVHIDLKQGYVNAMVKGRLKGAEIFFDKVSVGATENTMMAATLADGTTVISNAAREPEVADLADLLVKMGANIEGIGTDRLVIHGVEKLQGAKHEVIFDRIEAGSFAAAAHITGGNLFLKNADAAKMEAILTKLKQSGAEISPEDGGVRIQGTGKIHAVDISTRPYPRFPTDMQAQFMAMLSLADGASVIAENIFENRFMHVSELARMGADITIKGNTAIIRGVPKLFGAEVMATDLRASMCLVIAALAAGGETTINRIYHLDRGYDSIEKKLANVGAQIERVA
jgi:UDP-N-acetylglucosamine 1-carboxyvinyltransferase